MFAADDVVHFDGLDDELPRSAMAIRAGRRPLGTIWAIESDSGVSRLGRQTIIDGARLAALEILRATEAVELEQLAKEQALRTVLDGEDEPEAVDNLGLASDLTHWSPSRRSRRRRARRPH